MQADAQDGSGTNNANFSTPADGSPGRMQMYVFSGPTPDRDGDFDHEVVVHEATHGLSNRLVGAGVGISALQPRGMGEGWSDFYALCLLSEPTDDPNAVYATGGYATYQLSGMTSNYYYGIRRYPYSTDLTKNPLTFKDIDPVAASAHAGVPLSPLYSVSNSDPAEVHGQGEVWCAVLWEARANLIAQYGAVAGNKMILELVTDGMKLAPANPNFLQARDAILQADLISNGAANRNRLWTAFAKRGMGVNAISPASSTSTGVSENYDVPGDFGVTPSALWTVTGTTGGPFTATQIFTLLNSGTKPLNWTATKSQPWLALSATSGTLAPAASVAVTASFTAAANGLATGNFTDSIQFSDVTNATLIVRGVALSVEPLTVPIATETWESGAAGAAWAITGTNTHRTLVTTANVPHAGNYQLTMDSSTDGTLARNEATWTVDLAGRTNVQLRFWIKMFNDEANGPPTSPFIGGADFDGVAISADGTNWYEVQPLRTLVSAWTRYTVDLDAALAARGLTYNSAFKIRFNHYDDFGIPTDGFAFDDIELVSVVNNRVTITLPALASEGSGSVNGTIAVVPTPGSDLTVALISSLPNQASVPPSVVIPAGQSSASFVVALVDDALLDGTQAVTISAAAAGYQTATSILGVEDNETAVLTLNAPGTATEGDTPLTGTVTVSAAPGANVAVALSSSDATEIQVPATVTIPSGQTAATFPITIVNDARIDGTVTTSISAQVANWTSASTSIAVADNETRALTVTLPATVIEGGVPVAGSVRISGTLATPLVVSLASNDTSELTVPASVTIAAGQTTAAFSAAIVNDTVADGTQAVTVTASAAGFANATCNVNVADNDAHHFEFGAVASPRIPNAPFAVTVAAKDVNNVTITNYSSSVALTAAGSGGALALTPGALTGWVNGVWTGSVTIGAAGTNVVITASDGQGHTGASNAFNVAVGPLDHFLWNTIAAPQFIDAPFPVTLRAVDAAGNAVPTYNGAASLSAVLSTPVAMLSWTAYADLTSTGEYVQTKQAISTFFTNYAETTTTTTDAATLAAQLVGKNVFLIVEQENSDSTTLGALGTAWTTTLTNFVNGGGTIIVCSNSTSEHLLLTNSGLLNLTSVGSPTTVAVTKTIDTALNTGVAVPFTGSYLHTYTTTNGTVSLLTTAGEAAVISRDVGAGRVVMVGTDFYTLGTGMDRVIANAVALAQPSAANALPVRPAATGAFTAGVWTGNVSVPFTAAAVKMRATAGALASDSNAFAVTTATLPSNAATVLSEDFESGSLNPAFWLATGTGTFRTQVTDLYSPHAGTKHMTMDSTASLARNEATLSVNLAGRSGVILKFWAAGYNDEPTGPPTAPFTGGADFDGVAMSADGTTWWEIQGLRSLPSTYAQFTVDLDAALAARGLSYTPAFKIRFNQYDDFPLTTDGIVVDDILITAAVPPSTLALNLPAQVAEGAGVVNGSVSIPTALAADLVLTLSSKAAAKITVPASATIRAGQTSATFPLTVLDDTLVDGPKTVIVTASGSGYAETGATIQVVDNDGGTLSLTLPATVAENAGTVAGTLSLSVAPIVPLTVTLASNNPLAALPPASVTVPSGATSANFTVAIPDDGAIDGDQSVRVTATLAGWTPATADVVVQDNETRALSVTIPASFREGDAPKTGTVSLSGTLAASLVVSLASSDTSEITLPTSLTIPAGQTSATFAITVQDDTEADGAQPFTITASAATFTAGAASGQVRDNEAHHFGFATIGSPQVQNGPVPVIVTAYDPLGAVLTDYVSAVTFSATGSGGSVAVTPTSANGFINGVSSGSVQINSLATNVVLTASDGKGHTGASNPFSLAAGTIDRFVWNSVASPQALDTPFTATVRAVDAGGATVPAYNGVANLFVGTPSVTPTIGIGSSVLSYPIATYAHDSRTEMLYTAAEVGGAAQLTALALNVNTVAAAGETLTNWTIRLKHTTQNVLTNGAAWDNTGWTTVYRASPTISAAGWVTFTFTTPFDFSGASNLLVDFSMDRTATNSTNTFVQGTSTSSLFAVYGTSNSTNGDPLTWTGTTPYPTPYFLRANVRFSTVKETPIRPPQSGAFASGVWTGPISVPVAGTAMTLSARAGAVSGLSNAFDVAEAPVAPTGGATVFAEDFESGTLSSTYWTVTGTGSFHTINSNLNTPHAGLRHLTMDLATYTGAYARNEATLSLNLAGRSGVVLNFWARGYSEAAHGPPASPFPSTGADFDGVAISADGGANWYEVQPLRSLPSTYTQYTVNLDAALASRGLAYGANFKIRFNQYDYHYIPYRGIGIDDILVMANSLAGLAIAAPAQVVEGAGSVTATVTLDTAAASTTVVALTSSSPAKITVPASVNIPAGQTSATFTLGVLDDTIVDGNRSVAITGMLAGQLPRAAIVTVIDNDTLPIVLTAPATVVEGVTGLIATVTLAAPVSGSITIDLASDDITEITVPASVVIAAGQAAASFPITVVNDTLIDGTQSVTITASRTGWTSATASVQVADNETRTLALSGPYSAYEGLAASGTVTIPGTLPADLVVTLTSSNPAQFTVPASVTIPAGLTYANFTGTAVDDTATDGTQTVIITAAAATFTSGTTTTYVYDNDVHHFTFGAVATSVVRGQPFSVTVSTRDVNNTTISVFAGTVNLAANAAGIAVPMSPTITGNFSSGSWTGNVTMTGFGTGVVLTATDAGGHTGASTSFNVGLGTLNTLAWNTVPSPVTAGVPFTAAIAARDAYGNTMTGFNGAASLTCGAPQRTVGVGTLTSSQPFDTSAYEARSQCIYLASELGGAGRLTGLSLDVAALPGLPMTRFTVRLRPTTLAAYNSPYSWETTGWTTVYQGNLTVSNTGWVLLPFSAPYVYDGTSNLMVDFSFDNATSASYGTVRATAASSYRTYYGTAYGSSGDPLTWSGVTPAGAATLYLPNLRLRNEPTTPVSPSFVTLVNGVWTGPLTVGSASLARVLAAEVTGGIVGETNTFDALSIASLAVTPAGPLTTTGPRGGPFNPLTHTFTVNNGGTGNMLWTAATAAPWLSLSPGNGTLGPGASTTVTATLAPAGLASLPSGNSDGVITFSNVTNGVGSVTRTITVTATPAGDLVVTPATGLDAAGPFGGPFTVASRVYTLTNPGDAALNWTVAKQAPWLATSATSGTLAPQASATVTASIAAATTNPGNFVDSIVFTNTTSGRGTTTRTASLAVTLPAPILAPEPLITPATSNTISWNPVAGADAYEAEISTEPTFTNPSSSGWIAATNYIFTGLTDGAIYYYRVRDRRNSAQQTFLSAWSNVESSTQFNAPPAITSIAGQTILEDGASEPIAFTVGDDTTPAGSLLVTAGSSDPALLAPGGLQFSGAGSNRSIQVTPSPNENGTVVVTLRVTDEAGKFFETAFEVVVRPVNDAPSFVKGADQATLEDAGLQTVPGWAQQISAGPPNESLQVPEFIVANDNAALFTAPPAIAANGTLTYLPAADANGRATVTVRLQDSGGNADAGSDTSAPQAFTITVGPVNDAPTFTAGANQNVRQNSGAQTIVGWASQIRRGPPDEAGQTFEFIVTHDHPEIFATPPAVAPNGALTFTPAADFSGTATVAVRLHDGGGTENGGADTSVTQTFTITSTFVNDAPSFAAGANVTAVQNAGPQTMPGWATLISAGPRDEVAQTLNFMVSNDHPEIFTAAPAIAPDGTLTFTHSADTSGTALVTVRLHDNGGTENGGSDTSSAQTFTISSTFVNDAPRFVAGPSLTIMQNAGPQSVPAWATQISAGPPDEAAQALNFIITNDHPEIFAVPPTLTPNGMLAFTPSAESSGAATVSVRLHDSGGTEDGGADTSATQTFTITSTFVNDAPSFTAGGNVATIQNAGPRTVPGWATQLSAGPRDEATQALNFIVTHDHPELFTAAPAIAPNGTLTFTPSGEITGNASVTVRLHDSGGTENGGSDTSAAQTFTISSTYVNDAPSFVAGGNIETAQDAGPQSIPLWATRISAGPPDEAGQLLDFRVEVSDPALFATPPALAADGTLTYAPAPQGSGTATVTVLLHDDGGTEDGGHDLSAPKTFTIAITTFAEELGTYNGLVRAPEAGVLNAERFGLIRMNIARQGKFTGKLTIGGKTQSLTGRFDQAGNAHFGKTGVEAWDFQRKDQPALSIALHLDVASGTDKLAGTVRDAAGAFAVIEADRALFSADRVLKPPFLRLPTENLGSYTVIFDPLTPAEQQLAADDFVPGYGAGSLTVNAAGSVRLVATLADGTKFTYANALSKSLTWPLHHAHPQEGCINGMVHFRETNDSDLEGPGLLWFCPAAHLDAYPQGWPAGIRVDLIGAKYRRPEPNTAVLPNLPIPADGGNAMVTLTDGGLTDSGIQQPVSIGHTNKVKAVLPNASGVTITFNESTGLFSGKFKHPETGEASKVTGAIVQKKSFGAGSFSTRKMRGRVLLTPLPSTPP